MSINNKDMDQIIGLNNIDIEYQTELNIQYEKQIAIENIIKMYNEVIVNFKNGNLPVYNPNLFNFLSQEKFIKWAIQNNKNLKELFEI
ncbi:hypothetical protein QJ854_gp350 [Moumouvirus goulette]|uniref:Uncharacterized protein n=1 Tax=Moumouvirus goulette TaxID=1247379 RepID=M1PXF9_9VIRU|nr:hypothetical protein QJ854_gp350 [Moumouvirus goulette]AGF85432.1 hypothetical protein glt_00623 [Moumouvirus goulette]